MHQSPLKKIYAEQIVPELKKSLGISNIHDLPKLEKIVINSGINASVDKSGLEEVLKDISSIAGQQAIFTRARVSISNFKLRQGMPIGVKVTLRGNAMYDFAYRLINISLPNIRDFRGVPTRFDGKGNYTLGISDHTIFPEITVEGNKRTVGMDITFVTTAQTDQAGRELLTMLGMPFRKPSPAAAA
ncbi:MAG: 50S ribosomal protein L5 [Puniceicoccaceae bacterium]